MWLDLFGQVLYGLSWLGIPVGMYVVWRMRYLSRVSRIVLGVLFGSSIAAFLFVSSIAICFRDGMGP